MNRKNIFLAIMLLFLSLGVCRISEAKPQLLGNTFKSVVTYYGVAKDTLAISVEYHVTVATPQAVYYGVYNTGNLHNNGDKATLESWTGPSGTAPVLTLAGMNKTAGNANCPGMDTARFQCGSYVFDVTTNQDGDGCPWLATLYSYSYEVNFPQYNYTGPTVRDSICPVVPIDSYDISWNPNYVQHEKTLSLTPTGGTINQVLPTYLMESGTLCDGSKFDTRGAYCRFVATGITLTVLGCDNSIVTTTATAHPITDVQLHDINVAVNTKNVGPGTTKVTCNFQYIIDQL